MTRDGTTSRWQNKARCVSEDPELFFPVGNTGPAQLQIAEAKNVCRSCDVHVECLQYAIDSGSEHGVWGGLDEDERRKLKRNASRLGRNAVQAG